MVVLPSSANGTAARTATGTTTGSGKGTEANAPTDKSSAIATAMGTHTLTAAERTLLERAERVAAEFDAPTEQLDACVVEFVREMGAYFYHHSPLPLLSLLCICPT